MRPSVLVITVASASPGRRVNVCDAGSHSAHRRQVHSVGRRQVGVGSSKNYFGMTGAPLSKVLRNNGRPSAQIDGTLAAGNRGELWSLQPFLFKTMKKYISDLSVGLIMTTISFLVMNSLFRVAMAAPVQASWNAPSSQNATAYKLYKNGSLAVTTAGLSVPTNAEYGDAFYVIAVNNEGSSPPSATAYFTAPPIVPNKPIYAWSVAGVSSEELFTVSGGSNQAFDSNPSTFWQTSASSAGPHFITLDLKTPYSITGITITNRNDGSTLGNVSSFNLYISNDGVNWGTPKTTTAFAPVTGRYVKLVSTGPAMSIAELQVLGVMIPLPQGMLTWQRSTNLRDWEDLESITVDTPNTVNYFFRTKLEMP